MRGIHFFACFADEEEKNIGLAPMSNVSQPAENLRIAEINAQRDSISR